MISIRIGPAERKLNEAPASWIYEEFRHQAAGGHNPCVVVTIEQAEVHVTLTTPSCAGGHGYRPPNRHEQRIIELWQDAGLSRENFTADAVIQFLSKLKAAA